MSDIKVVKSTESKKTYTIKEFCKKYNDLKSAQAKGALIASILKKDKYVPFVMKDALMTNVVKAEDLNVEFGCYDDSDSETTEKFKQLKPSYLTVTRETNTNIHYAV